MATAKQPVDAELFRRTAPQWNCVDYPGDGMHLTPGTDGCLWCGMTREQVRAEWRETSARWEEERKAGHES